MHAGICLPATYIAQHPLYSQFYTGSLHLCTFPGSVADAEKRRIYSKKNNFKAFILLLKGSVWGAVPLEPSTRGTCLIQLLLPTSYPACIYSPIACFLSQASSCTVSCFIVAQPLCVSPLSLLDNSFRYTGHRNTVMVLLRGGMAVFTITITSMSLQVS